MSKGIKVLHHTRYAPFQTQMRGNEIYLLNHLRTSRHDVDIVSRKKFIDPEDKRIVAESLQSYRSGSRIHFLQYDLDARIALYERQTQGKGDNELITIHGTRKKVSAARTELAKMRQTKVDTRDASDYMETLRDQLKVYDRLVLVYHEMDKEDYQTIETVKQEFGDKVSVVGHLHCLSEYYTISDPAKKAMKERFEDLVRNGAFDRMIAVSDEVKRDFEGKYPVLSGKIEVVPGAVDGQLYSPGERSGAMQRRATIFDREPTDYVLSYVGRPSSPKGKDILLQLLRLYERSNPERLGFLFALPPEDRTALQFVHLVEETAPHLLSQGRIRFCFDISKYTAHLSPEAGQRLAAHIASKVPKPFQVVTSPVQGMSDIYIHPSSSESLGLSVIESIKTGIPIITTGIKGIAQYAGEHQGTYVPISQEYIDWTMKYDSVRAVGTVPQGPKTNVRQSLGIARQFQNQITQMIERMKSGEITLRNNRPSQDRPFLGRFARTSTDVKSPSVLGTLDEMVNRLDDIYEDANKRREKRPTDAAAAGR